MSTPTHAFYFHTLVSKVYLPGAIQYYEKKSQPSEWDMIEDIWTDAVARNVATEELAKRLVSQVRVLMQRYKIEGNHPGTFDIRETFAMMGNLQPVTDALSVAEDKCYMCQSTEGLKFERTGDLKAPTRTVCKLHTKEVLAAESQTSLW